MSWQQWIWFVSAIGSGLLAGVFLAFSNFIMAALARVEAGEGMRTMQEINRTVLNPGFLGLFMGTAILSIACLAIEFFHQGAPNPWSIGASLLYLIGGFAVTAAGNVPLNERLEKEAASDRNGIQVWQMYQPRWTRWNHVRTLAIGLASISWIVGLSTAM